MAAEFRVFRNRLGPPEWEKIAAGTHNRFLPLTQASITWYSRTMDLAEVSRSSMTDSTVWKASPSD